MLDLSLDRSHLAIAYSLYSALESAAGDRAHDAREVDLDPHLGVGVPIVHGLEFHSPARRGGTHRPGERQVAGTPRQRSPPGFGRESTRESPSPAGPPARRARVELLREPSIRAPLAPTPASVRRHRHTPTPHGRCWRFSFGSRSGLSSADFLNCSSSGCEGRGASGHHLNVDARDGQGNQSRQHGPHDVHGDLRPAEPLVREYVGHKADPGPATHHGRREPR